MFFSEPLKVIAAVEGEDPFIGLLMWVITAAQICGYCYLSGKKEETYSHVTAKERIRLVALGLYVIYAMGFLGYFVLWPLRA